MSSKSFVRIRGSAILAVLAFSGLSVVQATPVTWVTQGFTFSDGGSLFGGVTYDAATNSYSNSLIFSFGGSTFDNVSFAHWNPGYPVLPSFIVLLAGLPGTDLTGSPSLFIMLESSLDTPGLRIVLSPVALEALCADRTCSTVDQSTSMAAFGGELLSSSAVPEPSALVMLPAALLALAGWKASRRRRGGPV